MIACEAGVRLRWRSCGPCHGGAGLVGSGSGAANRRVDGGRRAAAALLQRGGGNYKRARGAGRCRPVGHDAGIRGRGACFIVTGLALRPAAAPGAGDPDRGRRRPAGRGEPRARQGRFAAACSVGSGRVRRPDGLAGRGLAARTAGAAGLAGGVGHRRGVLADLLAWFGTELVTGVGQADLAERVLGGTQAVWPLAVVLSYRPGPQATRRPCQGAAVRTKPLRRMRGLGR